MRAESLHPHAHVKLLLVLVLVLVRVLLLGVVTRWVRGRRQQRGLQSVRWQVLLRCHVVHVLYQSLRTPDEAQRMSLQPAEVDNRDNSVSTTGSVTRVSRTR